MTIQQIIDQQKYTFQLIKGYTKQNKPFYAFMIFNLARFQELRAKSDEWLDISKEGILVLGGKGHSVSKSVTMKAMEIFHTEYLKNK